MTRPSHKRAATEAPRRRIVTFVRADHSYPATLGLDVDPATAAELNPGTLRIEDESGNVLWRAAA